jgi:hemerythrin
MVWEESFRVKVAEIDEQHRRWIEIINELHDALTSTGAGGQLTERILGEMLDYAAFHFSFEEDYLRKIGYPELEKHRHQHQHFLDTILNKFQAEHRGDLVLNTEVMRLLTDWLRDHILTEDRKYMLFSQSSAK